MHVNGTLKVDMLVDMHFPSTQHPSKKRTKEMNSNKYQEKIMTRIKQINKEKMYSRFAFVNSLRGDRGRFFPYIPVAGQLAYQLFDIVQDDGWKIKKNIVNRYQAGKKILNNIYVNLNNLDLLSSLPCVDCLARVRTLS